MESGATGTGQAVAYSANTRMAALTVNAGTGTCFMQSWEYIPYQPGKGQFHASTFVFGAGVANVTVDVGSFDLANGVFCRQNGIYGLQFVKRSSTSGSAVDTVVSRVDWNIDKLDGTGPSGLTIDETKCQILIIDYQFLGMGRVRF